MSAKGAVALAENALLEQVTEAVGRADLQGQLAVANAKLAYQHYLDVVGSDRWAYLAGKGVEATRIRAEAKGESEATTGDACKDLGPDSATNQRLVKCLERDRRVEVKLVAR